MKLCNVIDIDLSEEEIRMFHNNVCVGDGPGIIDIQFITNDSGIVLHLNEKQLKELKRKLR